jgi:ribosomal subunit interface protein
MDIRYLFAKMKEGTEVTEEQREYIEKRLERIERLITQQDRFEVEVSTEKQNTYRVEIMVVGPKIHLRAEETALSIEAATDKIIDELETQLAKKGGKLRDLFLRGSRSIKKRLVVDKSARF